MGKFDPAQGVDAVRRFNRFYTRQIGVLQESFLGSPFSLSQVRVLYELAQRNNPTAVQLSHELGLDAGQLSRIVSDFQKRGLLTKEPSPEDGRQSILRLTVQGQQEFAALNQRQQADIARLIGGLAAADQLRLVAAMQTIETLLGNKPAAPEPYLLRPHQPGDIGWVIHRHAVLYAVEYGWDESFEALVAKVAGEFIQNFDARHERCWIAERQGEIVGSVFLVRQSAEVAKLRLLYVEPAARGLGIGARLVDECIRFAKRVGYHKITLWTNSILVAARQIYTKASFHLVASEAHHSFGHDLVGETWELDL